MERERKPPAVRGAPVAPPEDTWKVLVGCAVLLVLFPIWLVAAPRWYTALGELHESKGRLTSAVNAYDRALAVWPRLFDASELLFNRAVLLMSTEDAGSPRHADTEADLRTLLASQPDDANVNFNLGVVLSEMVDGGARAAEAEPYFRRALALAEHEEAEDQARRREAFGRLLSQLGRHEEAKQELERARALQPASLALQVSHAIVLHAAGELERSIALYTAVVEAMEVEGSDGHGSDGLASDEAARAYNNMAVALQEQGGLEQARAMFERAISIAPEAEEARRARANLDKLPVSEAYRAVAAYETRPPPPSSYHYPEPPPSP